MSSRDTVEGLRSSAGYRVEPARVSDLPLLAAVERSAATLFPTMESGDVGLPREIIESTSDVQALETARRKGLLWVVVAPEQDRGVDPTGGRPGDSSPPRQPAGFAHVEMLGGAAHLEELDVHRDQGRRGLGRMLVEAVCLDLAAAGHPALTLTTFRDVPWNAPFYSSCGFRELAEPDWSAELAERVRMEARAGLAAMPRVVMRRCLAGMFR